MIEAPWYGWVLLGVLIGWIVEWLIDNVRRQNRQVDAMKMQLLQREMTDWRVRAVDLDEQLRLTRQELGRMEEETVEMRHLLGSTEEQLAIAMIQLEKRERALGVALERLKSLGVIPSQEQETDG